MEARLMPSNYSELVSPQRLDAFFSPKSVALVGATDKSGWSLAAFSNLNTYKFPGEFYLVNPRGIDVHGSTSYKTGLDSAGDGGRANPMVPSQAVCDVLRHGTEKGIKNVVVLAAGCGEMGEEGKAPEQKILDNCNENGMTML